MPGHDYTKKGLKLPDRSKLLDKIEAHEGELDEPEVRGERAAAADEAAEGDELPETGDEPEEGEDVEEGEEGEPSDGPFMRLDYEGRQIEVPDEAAARELVLDGLRHKGTSAEPKVSLEDQRAMQLGRSWLEFERTHPDKVQAISSFLGGEETALAGESKIPGDENLSDTEKALAKEVRAARAENRALAARLNKLSGGLDADTMSRQIKAEIAKVPFLNKGTGARAKRAEIMAAEIMRASPGVSPHVATLQALAEIRDLVEEDAKARVTRQKERAGAGAENPTRGKPVARTPKEPEPLKAGSGRKMLSSGKLFQSALSKMVNAGKNAAKSI